MKNRRIKIYEIIRNMSITRKITISFSIIILIPVLVIGYGTFYQIKGSIQEKTIKNMHQYILSIENNVNLTRVLVENTANSITYSKEIHNFLMKGYVYNAESLNYYKFLLIPFMEHAEIFNGSDIKRISIYYKNYNVPEYGYFFLKENRIENLNWYKEFINSDKDESWIYRNQADPYNGKSTEQVFTFIKRIKSNFSGDLLGVVLIDVPFNQMYSAIDKMETEETFIITGADYKILNLKKDIDNPLFDIKLSAQLTDASGSFVIEDELYVYHKNELLQNYIILKSSSIGLVKDVNHALRMLITIIASSIVAVIISLHLFLKKAFKKLYEMVRIMKEVVVGGNFKLKITVDQNDEIGQLANDFNVLLSKINELVEDVIKKERAQKHAQIAALQYQINPHFIYNTIDIFRMKLLINDDFETAEAMADFGKILRYNMNSQSMHATIEQEIKHLKNYYNLQKLRYTERILLEIDLPDQLKEFKIIKFLLQPIIENCIKHGLKEDERLDIIVYIIQMKDTIQITIRDNGKGFEAENLSRINQLLREEHYAESYSNQHDGGIGLLNINFRLKLFYGDQYYIRISSQQNIITETTLTIPMLID